MCIFRIFFVFILSLVLNGISETCAQNIEFEVVTGDLPPYSVIENGQISGLAADIVKELISRVGYNHEIIVQPWKRAITESDGRRMTFPIIRSEGREKRYKWICPLFNEGGAFAVRADDKTVYNSIDDFNHLRIGVIRGAQTEDILKDMGFTHIEPVAKTEQNPKRLLADRIGAWFEGELIIKYTLQRMKIDDSRIKIVFRRPKVAMYLVASPDIPDNIIDLWRSKMKDIKSDGTYYSILKKYEVGSEFISD